MFRSNAIKTQDAQRLKILYRFRPTVCLLRGPDADSAPNLKFKRCRDCRTRYSFGDKDSAICHSNFKDYDVTTKPYESAHTVLERIGVYDSVRGR